MNAGSLCSARFVVALSFICFATAQSSKFSFIATHCIYILEWSLSTNGAEVAISFSEVSLDVEMHKEVGKVVLLGIGYSEASRFHLCVAIWIERFMFHVHLADPSPTPVNTLTSPLPSNQPQFNPSLTNNTCGGSDTTDQGRLNCERELTMVIIISAACGALVFCLIFMFLIIIFALLRKRWWSRRLVRNTGTLELHSTATRRRRRMVIQSNLTPRASPLLGRGGRDGSSTSSQQSQTSPISVTPNPSYCLTSVVRTPSSDAALNHHYDDLLALSKKEDSEPNEVYDTLEPNGTTRNGGSRQSHCSLPPPCPPRPCRSKSTPKSPPRPPRGNSTPNRPPWSHPTPTVTVHLATTQSIPRESPPNSLNQSTTREEYRLSTVSEGYVNEFDGPPCAYEPNSQLRPSPSLRLDTPTPSFQWRRGNPATYRPSPPQEYETPVTVRKTNK